MSKVFTLIISCLLVLSFQGVMAFATSHSRWIANRPLKPTLASSTLLSSIRGGASEHGTVKHIGDLETLSTLISQASTENKVVLIDFSATWCGPCQRIAPIFEKMAKEFEAKAHLVKVIFFFEVLWCSWLSVLQHDSCD
jgi:thiol-disulfide isomerase/thioredoxin